jgi:7,8-dihydropterin-6-yl-methyl-4-(beta-D-ribofuranosyl)aminobenzene 5'-phosphate synthase
VPVLEVRGPTEIVDHAHSTGELGHAIREQALVLESAEGPIVITGCAHPGVDNIVARAKAGLDREIHLVMGGFHLGGMSADQIHNVIARLKAQGVRQVGPCHCSGDLARELFRQEYGTRFLEVGVGRVIKIGMGAN